LLKKNYFSEGWELDVFEKSVPMSSYLVAFVVSNFKSVKATSPRYNVEVEVYGKKEAIESGYGDFALNETCRIIDFYSDYFNVRYPLKKSSINF
jgi:aminopeptidase N